MLLTGGPDRAETAAYTHVRDYDATTEGPRRPVTSTPHITHSARVAPHEKARRPRTTAATIAVS
jgi:hypothetical protein